MKLLTTEIKGIREKNKKNFTEQCKDFNSSITVSGFVSDKEVAQLLASSKIFVLPSRMEGFGLAVAEAMAAGLPCILSNLPALKENFHSAAVFVEPKNVEELAQAMLALLSDPEKRRKLKKRGRRLIKRFSWEAVAKKRTRSFRKRGQTLVHLALLCTHFSAREPT